MDRWRWVGSGALAGMLALLTAQRVPVFADNVALWTQAIRWAPNACRPRVNLAAAYRDADDLPRALLAAQNAVARCGRSARPLDDRRYGVPIAKLLDVQAHLGLGEWTAAWTELQHVRADYPDFYAAAQLCQRWGWPC